MNDLRQTPASNDDRRPAQPVGDRWGDAVMAGFTAVPNALIRAQADLKLTPNDVVVLLNIILHWWRDDSLPRPSTSAIAKRTGLSARTVQRALGGLKRRGLISPRTGSDGRREYDLSGLRAALVEPARRLHELRPEAAAAGG